MTDRARRKELLAEYKENPPEAGVYRIVNRENGKVLLGSTANLQSIRSKVDFARSTGAAGALGHRLRRDIQAFGIDAFELEILDVLEIRPEMTTAEIRADLATLEQLWREKYDTATLY